MCDSCELYSTCSVGVELALQGTAHPPSEGWASGMQYSIKQYLTRAEKLKQKELRTQGILQSEQDEGLKVDQLNNCVLLMHK